MTRVFGCFIEPGYNTKEFLKIGFSPSSAPLQQRWRNNGLSADFLADYLGTFFLDDDTKSPEEQRELKDAVNFIANELLENAMRYTYMPECNAVCVMMELHTDFLRFYVTNSIDPDKTAFFQKLIQRLLTEDAADLYMEQVTRNNETGTQTHSGLGFLTMINDYNAELAWKFVPDDTDDETITAITMVQIPV